MRYLDMITTTMDDTGFSGPSCKDETCNDDHGNNGDVPPTSEIPAYGLDEFKSDVRTWIELDDSIKMLQNSIKERKYHKKHLTNRIIEFMDHHDIEDLNTRSGRIRHKMTYVRTPLSQNTIKTRIESFFKAEEDDKIANLRNDLLAVVFNRERNEKHSLRRLN
jgi:Family of unknown function (DUF5760)